MKGSLLQQLILFFGVTVSTIYPTIGEAVINSSEIPYDHPNYVYDPCYKNTHLTDPEFTCCNYKKYNAPSIYSKDNLAKCFKSVENTGLKIVQSSWTAFQCLITEAFGSEELTLDKFTIKMSSNLPDNIKLLMKEAQTKLEVVDYKPYSGWTQLGAFEKLANIWNSYYTTETWACRRSRDLELTLDKRENYTLPPDVKCFNAHERSIRRGDCCKGIPLPFELNSDPIVLKYFALKNYTATNLMTLLGSSYNLQNSTVVSKSRAVSLCKRTSEFILQGRISLESIVNQIRKKELPDSDDKQQSVISEALIPKFLSSSTRDFFKIGMLRVDNTTNQGFGFDSTISDMMNPNASLYSYFNRGEWSKNGFDENSTRILLWTCRAHVLLDQYYKNVDYTDMCY